jgi:hypothetical protein
LPENTDDNTDEGGANSSAPAPLAADNDLISAADARVVRHIIYVALFALVVASICVITALSDRHLILTAVITYYALVLLSFAVVAFSYRRNRNST